MYSMPTIVAIAALIATANAHIKMNTPTPFNKDTLDTSPISKAQFPCKNTGSGFKVSEVTTMAVGSPQKLKFDGTAVHGGGSCQLSITMDTEPTANSVFKVIKSIEGGCPGVDGGTVEYDFTLPDSVPNGKATFAWTWFAKMSGAPELYMNCGAIEVTGGASDDTAFNTLPDMFVANLDGTCKSPENKAVKFPSPGAEVQMGGTNDVAPPTGDACGSSSGSPTPAEPSVPAGQPSTPQSSAVVQPSPPAGGQPSASPKPSAPAAPSPNPGGVFAPGASSVAPVPTPAQTSTTLVTVTAAPTPAKPTAPASPTNPSQPAPPSNGGASGSSCSTDGAIVCNGDNQFGLCNHGTVVWQDVAAGTICTNGVISKRSFNSRIVRPRYKGPKVALPVVY